MKIVRIGFHNSNVSIEMCYIFFLFFSCFIKAICLNSSCNCYINIINVVIIIIIIIIIILHIFLQCLRMLLVCYLFRWLIVYCYCCCCCWVGFDLSVRVCLPFPSSSLIHEVWFPITSHQRSHQHQSWWMFRRGHRGEEIECVPIITDDGSSSLIIDDHWSLIIVHWSLLIDSYQY